MTKTSRGVFEIARLERGDKAASGLKIVCGAAPTCDAVAIIPRPMIQYSTGGRDGDEQADKLARRKFESLGWRVGFRTREHRCPKCLEAERKVKFAVIPISKKEVPIVLSPSKSAVPPPARPSEEPPRKMDREDRRVLYAKISEVYVNETVGYSNDWTDEKVAKSLDCPRAWVTEVREEFFGPSGKNEQITAQIAEANAALAQAGSMLVQIDERRKALEGEWQKLDPIRLQLVGRIDRLTEALKAVR